MSRRAVEKEDLAVCHRQEALGQKRAVVFDLAVADGDLARGVVRDGGIVRDQDDGLAELTIEAVELGEDFGAGRRIEIAGRLVGEQNFRLVDQGPGDGDTLLLPAGELRGRVLARSSSPTSANMASALARRWRGPIPA